MLAAHACRKGRAWVLAHPEHVLPDGAQTLLERRRAGEPLAYILGWREFCGVKLEVSPAVLIPRQETEIVVEYSISLAKANRALRILDIGTGSGNIAVAIWRELRGRFMVGSDLSRAALAVARRNAEAHAPGVSLVQTDLLAGFGDGAFDLIVSNPPYVSTEAALPREVAAFEPAEALFAADEGLAAYRRLASEAPRALSKGGCCVVELGDGMAGDVERTFTERGWLTLGFRDDLSGMPRAAAFGL